MSFRRKDLQMVFRYVLYLFLMPTHWVIFTLHRGVLPRDRASKKTKFWRLGVGLKPDQYTMNCLAL